MIPHYRLSTALTRAWAINREVRHRLAEWLAHTYPRSGAAVCTDRLFVVAWVNPLGRVKDADPPYQRVPRHICANNPTWRDCECRRWFDPESGAAWGLRATPAHHPLCIFDAQADRRWREVVIPDKVVDQVIKGGFLSGEGPAKPELHATVDGAHS